MPRRRLGVALLLPDAVSREIDGLRRALGDGALGRMPPHITLVPPVNVREDDLADALDVLRRAAASTGPLNLTLGPVSTFHPDTPVIKLDVSGGDLGSLVALRDAVFAAPLERSLTWPFAPHVTLADDAEVARIGHAVPALDRFVTDVTVEHLTLLEEESGRRWEPLADVALGAPETQGRGSLPKTLVRSTMFDPVTRSVLGLSDRSTTLVITAFDDGELLGAVGGWRDGTRMTVEHCIAHPAHRGEGVGSTLLRAFADAAAEQGVRELVLGPHMPDPCPFTDRFGFRDGRLGLS